MWLNHEHLKSKDTNSCYICIPHKINTSTSAFYIIFIYTFENVIVCCNNKYIICKTTFHWTRGFACRGASLLMGAERVFLSRSHLPALFFFLTTIVKTHQIYSPQINSGSRVNKSRFRFALHNLAYHWNSIVVHRKLTLNVNLQETWSITWPSGMNQYRKYV